MKPTNVRYQAATKVNAVSPDIVVVGVDSLHALEGIMVADEMASLQPLHRDLRQWHDIERIAPEPGRPWQVFRDLGEEVSANKPKRQGGRNACQGVGQAHKIRDQAGEKPLA